MKVVSNILLLISISILLFSCNSKKRITYLYDLKDSTSYSTPINNEIEIKIQKDDLLSIMITSMHEESNKLFNSGTLATGDGAMKNDEYIVNKDGAVYLPVLGKVVVENLTKEEAQSKIKEGIAKYIKDPVVNVRFKNFKFTVMGLGATASNVYSSPTEKINVFEALAYASDVKVTGEIHNIILLRDENGKRNVIRLDLRSKEILNSPYYYIRQNDILYVEPRSYADNQSQRTFQNFMYGFTSITGLAQIIVSYYTIQELSKR